MTEIYTTFLPKVYKTEIHDCSYLPDRRAATHFIDPTAKLNNTLYHQLALAGYRRSGRFVYKPSCPSCNACQSMRILTNEFSPSRSQRRTLKRNGDLTVSAKRFDFVDEHYQLYCKYVDTRHEGGGMDNATESEYMEYFWAPWCDTLAIEFRIDGRLVGVNVMDVLNDGYSAVYTFFDPDEAKRSLGAMAIMWLIELAKTNHKPYVYLGYWIDECAKMAYKTEYRPCQILSDGQWQSLTDAPQSR